MPFILDRPVNLVATISTLSKDRYCYTGKSSVR